MSINKENLVQVMNHILEHPETWDQGHWHCGTKHCIAGHAQLMAGKEENIDTVKKDAREWLGLSEYEAAWLFDPDRTKKELYDYVSAVVEGEDPFPDEYNRAGYDRDGCDRAGYDRDGYNRDGYNRKGKRLPRIELRK
jgi:hypothetical protein